MSKMSSTVTRWLLGSSDSPAALKALPESLPSASHQLPSSFPMAHLHLSQRSPSPDGVLQEGKEVTQSHRMPVCICHDRNRAGGVSRAFEGQVACGVGRKGTMAGHTSSASLIWNPPAGQAGRTVRGGAGQSRTHQLSIVLDGLCCHHWGWQLNKQLLLRCGGSSSGDGRGSGSSKRG